MINKPAIVAIVVFLIVASSSLFISSCKHDPANLDQLDTVCFESQILPIIQTSCAISGCHAPTGSGEGPSIYDYSSIMRLVKPGDARGSKLYQVITNINNPEGMMPPNRSLSKDQRTLIEVWILQGAKDTKCPVDTTPVTPPVDSINWADSTCFNQDVLPVLMSNCAVSGCHNDITLEAGISFTSYANIMAITNLVVPNNLNNSYLNYVITTSDTEDHMPPNTREPLTSQQISTIQKWISEGAINSDCPEKTCDTTGTISFARQVLPAINTNCTGCHNTNGANGYVLLDSYDNIKITAEKIRNNTSLLLGAINHLSGFTAMPPRTMLDKCTIRKIELWIEQGKNNN